MTRRRNTGSGIVGGFLASKMIVPKTLEDVQDPLLSQGDYQKLKRDSVSNLFIYGHKYTSKWNFTE